MPPALKDPFVDVAKQIVPPDLWTIAENRIHYVEVVKRLAQIIYEADVEAKHSRLRSETRIRIKKLFSLITRLRTEIMYFNDHQKYPQIMAMFGDDRSGLGILPGERLRKIADALKKEAECISAKGGRHTLAEGDGAVSGQLVCAVAVRLLLRRLTDKVPGETNTQALTACELLWRAAGNEPTAAGEAGKTDPVSRWKSHIAAARTAINNAETPAQIQAVASVREALRHLPN